MTDESKETLTCFLDCDSCCRCPLPEPGPPSSGLLAFAGSTSSATGSRPAGAFPAAQGQQLLAAQPLPEFQHGKRLYIFSVWSHVWLDVQMIQGFLVFSSEKEQIPLEYITNKGLFFNTFDASSTLFFIQMCKLQTICNIRWYDKIKQNSGTDQCTASSVKLQLLVQEGLANINKQHTVSRYNKELLPVSKWLHFKGPYGFGIEGLVWL